jgi:3-keto-5-aminohexanoate cleavage enzyme
MNKLRKSSDIILQGFTGGLTSLTLEERCVALDDPRTEVASLNMGSVNFGEDVYINKLPDIRYWARRMQETNVAPELEIFEAGMIPVFRKFVDEKTLKMPFSINFCLGAHWALPADPTSLFFLKAMLTENIPWGAIHDGMTDFSLMATAIGLGATIVRVGFEDSVFYASAKAARTNSELVEKIASLIHSIGYEVAAPTEARKLFGLN